MKLISWNVNGIRAAQRGGFLKWFDQQKADMICLQEIKATPDQLDGSLLAPFGYHTVFNPAKKAGYAGTALYTREEPIEVRLGDAIQKFPEFHNEGRIIEARYKKFTLINAYFPNSQREHTRLGFKIEFCNAMLRFCETLRKKGETVILCGDFNIAHKEIDLKNPKANENNAGFLPEERAWMDQFISTGYTDAFRHFCKEGGHYTWWSYRPGVRAKNIGWRLDYFCINEESKDLLVEAQHQTQVMGSDHCPIFIRIKK